MAATTRKKKYLRQSPSQENPQFCLRTRWFCKNVQDGFPSYVHAPHMGELEWLCSDRAEYPDCRVPSHYQAPSRFSATWITRTATAGAAYISYSKTNDIQSSLDALRTTPFPGVFTRKKTSLILRFSYLPCTLAQKIHCFY